jgi:hypothetical protein
MRRLLVALTACALSSVLSAQGLVVTKNVNLRPTPSTEEPSARLIAPSEELGLELPDKEAGYYKVRTGRGETGWVWGRNVQLTVAAPGFMSALAPPGAAAFPLAALDTVEPGKYAMHDASCKPWGDGDVTQNDGLMNVAKRFIARAGEPVSLTINNFEQLQADTDPDAIAHKKEREHLTLTNRTAGTKTVSEGDRVSVSGFLARAADGSAAEKVNCKLSNSTTKDGRDIHINIGPEPNLDEYDGIVVEMIPQLPVGDFIVPARTKAKAALKKAMDAKLRVLAIGTLFYDNEHRVNKDKNNDIHGQPKRVSLWEIHPVLEFYVCPEGKFCGSTLSGPNGGNWVELSKWIPD